MPKIRIGLSTDFNLVGEQVGIGTTNPTARLDVAGQILAENTAGSGGISTFREYQGFSQTQAKITTDTLIDNGDCGPFSSLSGEIRITSETTVSSGSTVEVGKTKTLTVTDRFAVPFGDTNTRDNIPEAGTTRFNQDFGTLEFFDGVNWKTVNSYAKGGASGRAFYSPNVQGGSIIQSVQIHTTGNAVYFGDRASNAGKLAACFASSTRGVMAGGRQNPSFLNNIDYITIPSFGNSQDFGDLLAPKGYVGGLSSSTRGLIVSQYSPVVNVIEYVQISTTGDALDFGDQSVARMPADGVFASPTRGVVGGGWVASATKNETIDYSTIASKGDAIDFGDLTVLRSASAGGSNAVRGIFMGGYRTSSEHYKTIDYVTIASTGNAIDFGERIFTGAYSAGAASQTRMVCLGGFNPGSIIAMDYIEISTTGNSKEFGDAFVTGTAPGGASDSHGGLGGF